MASDQQLIRCWQSEDATKRVAALIIYNGDQHLDSPIFQGETDGEAAGKVLAWMLDSGLVPQGLAVGVH